MLKHVKEETDIVFLPSAIPGIAKLLYIPITSTFFLTQTFLSWWLNLQFPKYVAENILFWPSVADPYKVDNSSRLSWISKCSFWPGRRHFWVFHSFMSETAPMFNSSSQTQSKPYCYLINIFAWFPGQLLVLSAVIKLPSAVLLRWNIWMYENNMQKHFCSICRPC